MSTGPARDPGMQQERTWLAWSRTGLSLTVAAAFVAVHAGTARGWPVGALGVLAGLLALAAVVRIRRLSLASPEGAGAPGFDRVLPDGRWLLVLSVVAGTLLLVEVGLVLARW